MFRPPALSAKEILSFAVVSIMTLGLLLSTSLTVRAQDEPPATSQDAVEFFNRGQDEHGKGELLKAIELYDKALRLLPEFPEAEFQKGNAYLSLGRQPEAESAFRRAVELRADWTLALVALGSMLERRGEFGEAEKLLNKAISLDNSSFPAYSAMADMRLRTKASPDVLRELLEKVRAFSSKASPTAGMFSTQASLEKALGDNVSAKKSIGRALEMDPNSKSAFFEKADIALAENDPVLAEEVLKSVEKLDSASEPMILLRSKLLLAEGKTEDARRLLGTIVSPSPEAKDLIAKLALVGEQSADTLEKALAKDPKDAFILGRLCSAYRVKDAARALDFCRRALDTEPSNANYAIGLGAALVQLKRFDEAVTFFRRLNSMLPDNSTIHANLGTALFELKRFSEAKWEYEWLTSRQPSPAIAYYFLAICLDPLGKYMDAGANYNQFLKLADAERNKVEVEKVKLRLPLLEKQIRESRGSRVKSG